MKARSNRNRGEKLNTAYQFSAVKVVLLGETGVGKSALGWCLAEGKYRDHPRNHPVKHFLMRDSPHRSNAKRKREIIIWDMASHPDYRIIHPLSVNDADLALIAFDPTIRPNPLAPVDYWVKQISDGHRRNCPVILVGTREEVGASLLLRKEFQNYCRKNKLNGGYFSTSAANGTGLSALRRRIRSLINWNRVKKAGVTTGFAAVKSAVQEAKNARSNAARLLSPKQLLQRVRESGRLSISETEIQDAVAILSGIGIVRILDSTDIGPMILVAPELFDSLAASLIRLARQHERGLGAIEEDRLLKGEYSFPEIERLPLAHQKLLLKTVTLAFLENKLTLRCQREAVGNTKLLLFPDLITQTIPILLKPHSLEDDVLYTVSGEVASLFAVVAVSLAYTNHFSKVQLGKDEARYEFHGIACAFCVEPQREMETDFILRFDAQAEPFIRELFRNLVQSFLGVRRVSVKRYEAIKCSHEHRINGKEVRNFMMNGRYSVYCTSCGELVSLPMRPTMLSRATSRGAAVHATERRVSFEKVLFRLKTYVSEQKLDVPECFISYAWGKTDEEKEHEYWVEKNLATDLQKAGVNVLLDKWENSRIGSSIARFVERIEECDQLIVVGTPLYRQKAKNVVSAKGSVTAAEWDLAGIRMLATEAQKQTVLPVLLAGEESEAFPALLRGRVYADFRNNEAYFDTALELLLSLYQIKPQEAVSIDLRESLAGRKT